MITAVDTNVLIDIFENHPTLGAPSLHALRRCLQEGRVVACDAVWAETAAYFESTPKFESVMAAANIHFDPLLPQASALAGETWRHYRKSGGPRIRVLADFLVGAHAFNQGDRLLTRDRDFYRKYFRKLVIFDPIS